MGGLAKGREATRSGGVRIWLWVRPLSLPIPLFHGHATEWRTLKSVFNSDELLLSRGNFLPSQLNIALRKERQKKKVLEDAGRAKSICHAYR